MKNQKEHMMKIKSKRLGEITAPDRNNQLLDYSTPDLNLLYGRERRIL